jgi:transposase-like protein
MEKSGKRGKIPQSDWPLIMARYEGGETLSSIARTYDCSPPAISYIVSRSRGKSAAEATSQSSIEAQLVKSNGNNGINGSAVVEPTGEALVSTVAGRRETTTELRQAVPSNEIPVRADRRTLHLSLGNGAGNTNGNGGHAPRNGDGHSPESPPRPSFIAPPLVQHAQQPMSSERSDPRPFHVPPRAAMPLDSGRNGHDLFAIPEGRPAAQQPRETDVRKDSVAFIDQELRSRVDGDIAAFLAAFDAALAADTHESRFGLREATDRLLRAGARTRIELERLEARVPLPPREGAVAPSPAAWRHR